MRKLALALACSMTALAASPVIRDLAPHGAQRGKTVQLVLKGSGLTPGAKLVTTLPANVSRLSPSKDLARPETELPFLVELNQDAAIGLYPVRILTEDGWSNVMLFAVGHLPETLEKEIENPKASNGETPAAEPVTTPVVINGTLTDADVDLYAFPAKAGQKLVFEVEANRMASAIDPALELLDAAGKVIAKNDDSPGSGIDARFEHTFARAGNYYVRIHDSKYSAQDQNFYRLKIGSYPYSDAMFPLGWRRGEPVGVELNGGNLAEPVTVKPDTTATRRQVPVPLPGSMSLPPMFRLSDKPEHLERDDARALSPGAILNGRISKKGEVDRYTLPVKPGEHWVFELVASSTGASQLDALMTLYDRAGKKLASRDDLGGGADPVIPFEAPQGVEEVVVAVEDLLARGGAAFGYRLEARKEAAEFTVQLATPFVNVPAGGTAIVNVALQRRGYDGAARVMIGGLPPGFSQAGGHVAPAYAAQRFDDPNPRFSVARSTITITAGPEAGPIASELRVMAVADTRDGRILRYAEGPGLSVGVRGLRQKAITAPWLEMELPVATARALPVKLATTVPLVRISQGVEYPMQYRVQRGMNARIQGNVRENIATQVGNLRILQGPAGKSPEAGSLLINTNFATPMEKFDLLPQAVADIEGQRTDIYGPMVTFEVVPGYRVSTADSVWTIRAGERAAFRGIVYREPTFEGSLVRIEVQDTPAGVSCDSIEVPGDAAAFQLTCAASGPAAKGKHEIRLVSQAPDTGRKAKDTYKSQDVTVEMRIE